jgi:hypothetical protein
MGRKRKYPQVVFLRVFNEGEKLTEEQKEWLLNNKEGKNGKRSSNIPQRHQAKE